jgi:hypothetical protein
MMIPPDEQMMRVLHGDRFRRLSPRQVRESTPRRRSASEVVRSNRRPREA